MLNQKQISSILQLVEKAADVILSYHGDSKRTVSVAKNDHSPLSHADTASNDILIPGLIDVLDIPVLSEENAENFSPPVSYENYWLIDPLDGTKGFLKKNGEFAINIALISDSKPVFGVISVPVERRHFFAYTGQGCYVESFGDASSRKTLKIDTQNQPAKLKLIVSRDFSSHDRTRIETQIGPIETEVIGSSIKFCRLAEGLSNLYLRLTPSSEWDIAPGIVILKEAGCNIVDLNGRELQFNKHSYLNPAFVAYSHRQPVEECGILSSLLL